MQRIFEIAILVFALASVPLCIFGPFLGSRGMVIGGMAGILAAFLYAQWAYRASAKAPKSKNK